MDEQQDRGKVRPRRENRTATMIAMIMILGDLINRRRQYRVAELLVTYLGLGIYSCYGHVLLALFCAVPRCFALLYALLYAPILLALLRSASNLGINNLQCRLVLSCLILSPRSVVVVLVDAGVDVLERRRTLFYSRSSSFSFLIQLQFNLPSRYLIRYPVI